jgi:hypothetical protein
LDAQVSGLFGSGLGRYGSSQFSDVFLEPNGELGGIRQAFLLAGLTGHPTKTLDVYLYYGQENSSGSFFTIGGVQGGFGNPLFSNLGGCEVPATQLACNGNTQFTEEITVGLWDKAYTGDFGSFRLGLQYAFVKRESFSGIVAAAAPPLLLSPVFGQVTGDDNMVYTSIRYYPFQK